MGPRSSNKDGREEEEEKEEEEEAAQNFLLYLLPVQGEEPGCGGVRGGRGGRGDDRERTAWEFLCRCRGWISATQWSMMFKSASPMKRALAFSWLRVGNKFSGDGLQRDLNLREEWCGSKLDSLGCFSCSWATGYATRCSSYDTCYALFLTKHSDTVREANASVVRWRKSCLVAARMECIGEGH